MQNYALSKEGKCLSSEYKSSDTKYDWECKNKHVWSAQWENIKQGHWCPYCANRGGQTIFEDIFSIIEEKQGKIIKFNYLDSNSKHDLQCHNNHFFSINWRDLRAGNWCNQCTNQQSSQEKEIGKWLTSLGIVYETKFRPEWMRSKKTNRKLELDLFLPDYNLGIELHGLYWHSERIQKNKFYAQEKYTLCQKQNINLIQIYEDEWKQKSHIVKSIILNKIKKSEKRVFARKCLIKEVSFKERKKFFEENHIAGDTKSKLCFGLYLNEELVSCISFRKPFTKRYEDTLEIARFASKLNTNVVGGFSRLFTNSLKHLKCKQVLTYADLRWGEGNTYLKYGFQQLDKTPPNFYWVEKQKRVNRLKYRKNSNPDYVMKYGDSETEQNTNNDRYRIYDAGNNKYLLKLN